MFTKLEKRAIPYPLGNQKKKKKKDSASGLPKYIEDIYFFKVNTKYISSNMLKISAISRVRSTSEIADIFNT